MHRYLRSLTKSHMHIYAVHANAMLGRIILLKKYFLDMNLFTPVN